MNRAEKNTARAQAIESAYNRLIAEADGYEQDAAKYKEDGVDDWGYSEKANIIREVAETILTKLA